MNKRRRIRQKTHKLHVSGVEFMGFLPKQIFAVYPTNTCLGSFDFAGFLSENR